MISNCPIKGFDHLEFYVGNAKQASFYYHNCFGFDRLAYCGLETGEQEITSYVLEQGKIRLVISSAISPEHPISQSVLNHGDTIAVVALAVADVSAAFEYAVIRGATGLIPPTIQEDEYGVYQFAAISSFGDTIIKFVDRSDYSDTFAPGYKKLIAKSPSSFGLTQIDHVVGNVEEGMMNQWVKFFVETMGFDLRMHFDNFTIATEYSALMSKVLDNGNQTIININEPAKGLRKSQIQEYLDFHHGAGIQHLGLATQNIVQTVTQLRTAGVEFLQIPQSYYENLEDWVKELDISIKDLSRLGILVDRDVNGHLFQLFTKPIGDRPTLFFEIVERCGSQGFGEGNFKSLFTALEREQALRGTL